MRQVERLLQEHRYPPSLIYNFDETMVYPGKRNTKVIVRSHGPRPIEKILNKGEHITFGLCIAADGSSMKPLCILPLKTMPNLPPSMQSFYVITGQASGWIDTGNMGAMGNWSVHSICVSKEEFHIRSQSKGSSAGRCSFHTNF